MSDTHPKDLRYTESHEYLRVEGAVGTIGLSQHAVTELNELIFFELPEIGDSVTKGEPFGTVEAVKAVFDLNSPVSGEVTEVNQAAIDDAQSIAEDPQGDGWLIRVKLADLSEAEQLMDSDSYAAHCAGDAH